MPQKPPVHLESSTVTRRLMAALQSAGIFLSAVYLDDQSGKVGVVVRGKLSIPAARKLATLVERGLTVAGLEMPPSHTRRVEAGPTDIRVGDYVCLNEKYYPVETMRAPSCDSRVLTLTGYPRQWVITSVREVYRPIRSRVNGL